MKARTVTAGEMKAKIKAANKIGINQNEIDIAKNLIETNFAILLCLYGVRSELEEIHGKGKITDKEMESLNKKITNNIYSFITEFNKDLSFKIALAQCPIPNYWNIPKIDNDLIRLIKTLGKQD